MRLQRPKYTKLDLVFCKMYMPWWIRGKTFFGDLIFTFLGGQGGFFFVGCDVFQKLRIISKIADHAFEMVMTIDLILQRGLFSPRMIRNFCKTQDEPRGWEKNGFWRGKTHRISPKKFLRPRDTYKKYILQKNWVKTAIPALSSRQSNLHTPIWGCHRQLDDQLKPGASTGQATCVVHWIAASHRQLIRSTLVTTWNSFTDKDLEHG